MENCIYCQLETSGGPKFGPKIRFFDLFDLSSEVFSSKSTLNSTEIDREIGKTLLEYRVEFPQMDTPNGGVPGWFIRGLRDFSDFLFWFFEIFLFFVFFVFGFFDFLFRFVHQNRP